MAIFGGAGEGVDKNFAERGDLGSGVFCKVLAKVNSDPICSIEALANHAEAKIK